ncbi:nucleotidyltransferase domain-containing protein [Litchfieldia alkalitelluris]|uniref:nucleotidyltransferase domain-containing protein n=1 Tax=Litchfieldia alkalitelluris TaxID=304268 RepID=UPI0009963ED3|nr:nucleotidyltransferase domain-containing protein [Litchfieldia alkalitelluris]
MNVRFRAIEAAKQFITTHFPDCHGALLAGSVVRGESTKTSDLDIVVFQPEIPKAYRESLIEYGWNIELFVHNLTSYRSFFESDSSRGRPSLPRMVSEGMIIKDTGVIEQIKIEAKELLDNGPEEWPNEIIRMKRYFITDTLDDFIGCTNRAEGLFIANSLAELVSEFVLRTNNQWLGSSKWVVRALKQFDEAFTENFINAFDAYYKTDSKDLIIGLVDQILQPFGGRLFEGFSLGKD